MPKLLADNKLNLTAAVNEKLSSLQTQGKTVTVVALDGVALGLIAVADRLRPSSRQAISELKALGIQVGMLTGDNKRTVLPPPECCTR